MTKQVGESDCFLKAWGLAKLYNWSLAERSVAVDDVSDTYSKLWNIELLKLLFWLTCPHPPGVVWSKKYFQLVKFFLFVMRWFYRGRVFESHPEIIHQPCGWVDLQSWDPKGLSDPDMWPLKIWSKGALEVGRLWKKKRMTPETRESTPDWNEIYLVIMDHK